MARTLRHIINELRDNPYLHFNKQNAKKYSKMAVEAKRKKNVRQTKSSQKA